MQRMGFANRWISLLMTCMHTVSYAIVVNGQPVGRITPSKGIRQWNPMFPYLFLMCAEALSSLLHHAESSKYFSGVPTSKRGPQLSHLFFADDSLLFCKANSVEWHKLMRLLEKYEGASD